MNTVIVNQYGSVQAEITRSGLVLRVEAQTPRHETVHVATPVESAATLLHLLAILRAVNYRLNQCQLKNSNPAEGTITLKDEAPEFPNPQTLAAKKNSGNKIYGRLADFVIYEQRQGSHLRIFLSVRDDRGRIARFDLNPGGVEAFQRVAERALFWLPEIELALRDESSLKAVCQASGKGLVFEVQAPPRQSHFLVGKAHNVATLAVFLQRVLDKANAAPIEFGNDAAGLVFRKGPDASVEIEFRMRGSRQVLRPSCTHLYHLEVLARYVLHRSFEPQNGNLQPAREGSTPSLSKGNILAADSTSVRATPKLELALSAANEGPRR